MLQRTTSNRLCQPCRSDIHPVLTSSFSTTTPCRRTSFQYVYPRIAPVRRPHARFHDLPTASLKPYSTVHKEDQVNPQAFLTEEEILASQRAAVEALEQDLEQATIAELADDTLQDAEYVFTDEHGEIISVSPDNGPDSFAVLRDGGASPADVVKAARVTFGDTLPEGLLTVEEVKLYTRLYGEPLFEVEYHTEAVREEDVGAVSHEATPPELYSVKGEPINYQRPQNDSIADERAREYVPYSGSSETAVARGSRMLEIAQSVGGTVMESGEWEDEGDLNEDDEDSQSRSHPFTQLGKFATNPRTVFLSKDGFTQPFENIMSTFSNKHLKEMCERTFGGPGLPDSPLTPRSGSARKQVAVPLTAGQHTMGGMEANAFVSAVMPPTYASIMSAIVETRKRLGVTWLNNLLAKEGGPRILDAGSGGVGVIAWREIVRAHWETLHTSDPAAPPPPSSKPVVLTGSDELRHRAAAMLENTTFIPRLPDYVHTRDTATLEDDRPAQQRKQFDVIIASHSLFSLKEEFMRKQHVQNLWSMLSPDGGVLILIEKGVPRGFEAIAGAREMLLERYIAVPEGHTTRYSNIPDDNIHKRETAMIVAPCTNHERCPMYTTLGLSRGRKDICSFQQRYIRPGFMQRVLGAKDRNHDDVDFSYLSVMKGKDLRLHQFSTWEHVRDPLSAPVHSSPGNLDNNYESWLDNVQSGFESFTPETTTASITLPDGHDQSQVPATHSLPRAVYPPMKRRGHVTIDLCTPAGKIERWTIPRSFGKQAYRDARKARWGDLWALGAKTRIPRNLRLGVSEKDMNAKGDAVGGIHGKVRGRKERLKVKAQEILEAREQDALDMFAEEKEIARRLDDELLGRIETPYIDGEDQKTSHRKGQDRENLLRLSKRSAVKASSGEGAVNEPAKQTSYIAPDTDLTDDQVDSILAEWQAEFDQAANPKRHGSQYSKKQQRPNHEDGEVARKSKEARRMEKENRKRAKRGKFERLGDVDGL